MNFQRKCLLKHLLNKNSNYVSLFGALFCFTHLNFLLWFRGLEKWEVARASLDLREAVAT
jgi:hypothetical protein